MTKLMIPYKSKAGLLRKLKGLVIGFLSSRSVQSKFHKARKKALWKTNSAISRIKKRILRLMFKQARMGVLEKVYTFRALRIFSSFDNEINEANALQCMQDMGFKIVTFSHGVEMEFTVSLDDNTLNLLESFRQGFDKV